MDNAEERIPALLEAAAPYLYVVTINGTESRPAKPDGSNSIKRLAQGSYEVGIVLGKLRTFGFTGPIGLQCFNLKGDPDHILSIKAGRYVPPARARIH